MSESIRGRILEGVTFDETTGVGTDRLEWDETLGFLVDPQASAGSESNDEVRVVGFAAPYYPGGEVPQQDIRSRVRSITYLYDLPASLQTVDHTSKGVGLRVYTDAATALSGSDVANAPNNGVAVYGVTLRRECIVDRRQTGVVARVGRHAMQRALEAISGTEAVVNAVHRSYADAQAVRMHVPPRGQMQQRQRRLIAPEGVEPGFLVVRDPLVVVSRLGKLSLDR